MKWYTKCLFMCYFICQAQKITIFREQCHHPYLVMSKAFHQRQSRFEILQHIKNSGEGFHQPPPPLPLCSTQGVWICVYFRRSMYLILTIFLYLLVNRFAVRISLPFIYGIAYKLFLPIQEPTTEAPSTSIRFCLKTEFFSPLVPPIVYM